MPSATAGFWRRTRHVSRTAPRAFGGGRGPATCCSCSAQATSTAPSSSCARAGRAMQLEQNVPLARYTTIGTGGPARWFARPETVEELHEHLRSAHDDGVGIEVVGLGSNLLADDAGVDALVLKLAGDLASAHVEGETLVMGGGAANAVGLHRARSAGLGGFEFASAIPGTAGGGVRMNAGAYGREWRDILVEAVVVDARGARTVDARALDLSYRRSGLRPGEVVAQMRFGLERSTPGSVKARAA